MLPSRCHIWPRATGLTAIIAWELTQIVTTIFGPWRLFEFDSNTGSPQAISILCQMESNLFGSPTYVFLPGATSGQGPQA